MQLHRKWMGWWDYSGGEMTNWGAHGIDQIQMALGMDTAGPVEFWPIPDGPPNAVAFRYANGVTVRLEMPPGDLNTGGIFVGEKGRIEIVRNGFRTDPAKLVKDLPPEEEVQKWNRAQWQAKYHMQEWLECMRSRKTQQARRRWRADQVVLRPPPGRGGFEKVLIDGRASETPAFAGTNGDASRGGGASIKSKCVRGGFGRCRRIQVQVEPVFDGPRHGRIANPIGALCPGPDRRTRQTGDQWASRQQRDHPGS